MKEWDKDKKNRGIDEIIETRFLSSTSKSIEAFFFIIRIEQRS